jgi:hypothetical protein
MGYDYQAKLSKPLTAEQSEAFIEAVTRDSRWVVVSRSTTSLQLRDASKPVNPRWPVDAQLEIQPDRIYVLFHGGPHGVGVIAQHANGPGLNLGLTFEDL